MAEASMSALVPLEHLVQRPVSIGARADVVVRGAALADEHLYLLVRRGRLLVASADTIVPSVVEGSRAVIPSTWVALGVPSRIRIGEVLIRLSWRADRSEIDLADEVTPKIARRPKLPPVSPPPRRAPLAIDDEITLVSPRDTSTVTATMPVARD